MAEKTKGVGARKAKKGQIVNMTNKSLLSEINRLLFGYKGMKRYGSKEGQNQ